MPSNPRQANGHRRRQLRARVLREESECWLCGLPVDVSLPPHLDGSPEVDEVIPVSAGGDPLDRNNTRLAHRLCNVRRGQQAKEQLKARRTIGAFETTRTW
jgi:5-methylcytosine-specific restriction endonuclease McrA